MDKNRALRLEVQTLKRELYEARRQSAGWHAIVKIVNQYSSVPPGARPDFNGGNRSPRRPEPRHGRKLEGQA